MVIYIFNFSTWVAVRYLSSMSKIHMGFRGSYRTAMTTQRTLVLETKIYKKYKAKYYYINNRTITKIPTKKS